MKIKNKIIAFIAIVILFTSTISQAQTESTTIYEETTESSTQELSLYSEAAILIDSSTGKILYEKNSEQKMYPASTTKILTAIIALEECNLTDTATASYNAIMSIPSGYSNAAIQENEELSIQDLLDLFLIHSANEVGYILAEHISGSVEEFANLMNKKATEIGCTSSNFTNPSGIHDENHYSTAYDMALIAMYCMKNNTFREIVSKTSCTIAATDKYEERYYTNTNELLNPSSQYYYEYAIGIKTGYTSQAKNCLIAASTKDNLELITVVLGAESTENGKSGRNIDTINLFNYGYSNYIIQEIVAQNSVIDEISISNATKETATLQLLAKESITTTTPIDLDLTTLNYSIEIDENLSAPISEGAVVGKITYEIDGITYSTDLLAGHNVEKSNLTILIIQIASIILILLILSKIISNISKSDYGKHKEKRKSKNLEKNYDSIYKFN